MKNSELEALGLDKTTIEAVQQLHGRDLQRMREKQQGEKMDLESVRTRAAIAAMLPVIRQPEHLRALLMRVTRLFYEENRLTQAKGTAADAANTDDGNQAVQVDPGTASSITE